MDYTFLSWVAIILVSTKALGLLVRRFGLPEVVGYLIAGILIGPSCLGIITMDGPNGIFLQFTSEFGVIFLMFDAGLTTDLKEMKKNLVASVVVAVLGVVVPLVVGTLVYAAYYHMDLTNYNTMVDSLFIGVVLTATSVSITVQTLRELGHLNGAVGTTILGAAVIDDILGIIVLTIVSSMRGSTDGIGRVFMNIIIYGIMIAGLLFLLNKAEPLIKGSAGKRRTALFAFAFCFALSYISEHYFGITDITGAYFAGLMLCNSEIHQYISTRASNVTNLFFGCVFFACIGIKVSFGGMAPELWVFAILLTVVAILTKVIGCGLGALATKFKPKEALQIGVGMISRGEVALIVADKGRSLHMLPDSMFAPVIIVVIATTLITPILLKMVFANTPKPAKAA